MLFSSNLDATMRDLWGETGRLFSSGESQEAGTMARVLKAVETARRKDAEQTVTFAEAEDYGYSRRQLNRWVTKNRLEIVGTDDRGDKLIRLADLPSLRKGAGNLSGRRQVRRPRVANASLITSVEVKVLDD